MGDRGKDRALNGVLSLPFFVSVPASNLFVVRNDLRMGFALHIADRACESDCQSKTVLEA
jgi:hypothetical protein